MREKLTDNEYNVVMSVMSRLKLDGSFDIYDCGKKDLWKDWNQNKMVDLKTGFSWLAEAINYPLSHEGFSRSEAVIIADLLREYVKISDDFYEFIID